MIMFINYILGAAVAQELLLKCPMESQDGAVEEKCHHHIPEDRGI